MWDIFLSGAMADASALVDKNTAEVFLKNAVFQAKTSINLFYDTEKQSDKNNLP